MKKNIFEIVLLWILCFGPLSVFAAEEDERTPLRLSPLRLDSAGASEPESDARKELVSAAFSSISAQVGGGVQASGGAHVYIGSHVSQLVSSSKFSDEYGQLLAMPSPASIAEFEHLLKVYEMNPTLAPLYMKNFEDIGLGKCGGEPHPISLEYFADLKTEYIRSEYLLMTMGINAWNKAIGKFRCCDDPYKRIIRIKRAGYMECLETYKTCRGFYRVDASHRAQIDIKISRVEEYVSFLPSEGCCVIA